MLMFMDPAQDKNQNIQNNLQDTTQGTSPAPQTIQYSSLQNEQVIEDAIKRGSSSVSFSKFMLSTLSAVCGVYLVYVAMRILILNTAGYGLLSYSLGSYMVNMIIAFMVLGILLMFLGYGVYKTRFAALSMLSGIVITYFLFILLPILTQAIRSENFLEFLKEPVLSVPLFVSLVTVYAWVIDKKHYD